MAFRTGAFQAAAQAGIPVVPVALRGVRSVLRDGTWYLRRAAVSVTIGAPIAPEGARLGGGGEAARRGARRDPPALRRARPRDRENGSQSRIPPEAMAYLLLKQLHVACAVLSISGFALRGVLMLRDSPAARRAVRAHRAA